MIGWRCCGCWSGTPPIILGPVPPSSASSSSSAESKAKPQTNRLHIAGLVPLALSLTFAFNSPTPSLAIPSLNSPFPSPSPSLPTTPFSQSKDLPLGLQDDGKIRPCPSVNPGCISSNPKSSSFAFPWRIPDSSSGDPLLKLKQAILQTQRNPKFLVIEDTPYGQYLQAEVDGGFGRDVLEFLVKGDVVAYRCMAAKVTYVYPFTTALGDSKGQEERLKKIADELGWYAPSFDSMD
ncbi:thylakoid lumenal 17.9 kDa protein, chloroplastic [Rhodamnia argentea]|uniref:Thylakoid lumenal 17.9 kDa protein, chloroplastic n=1 Tax=Rhodamnia argentea TaxID=178133 RepID=A0A8B8P8E5_9MYRT|nr:thylakoid lumenal 17.9 kDa protein, chloroplastic [Rhodamnia argentea]